MVVSAASDRCGRRAIDPSMEDEVPASDSHLPAWQQFWKPWVSPGGFCGFPDAVSGYFEFCEVGNCAKAAEE
jgi:hypothetical protein